MSRIRNGVELSKQSWGALRQNRQLIIFPIISMLGIIITTALFLIPGSALLFASGIESEASAADFDGSRLLLLGVFFVYYLIAYFFVIFSNTALVGATLKLINGERATVGDGIRVALSHLGKIFVYALISATVGVLARSISQSGRNSNNVVVAILTAMLGALIQGAWSLLVFFALPVMIVENLSVGASLKRSLEIFKRTWGESFAGNTAVGGVSCLVTLSVLLVTGGLIAAGVALDSVALIIVGGVLMGLSLVVIGLLRGAINGIFQASLYHFATTGNAGPFVDTKMAREAFR